MRGNLSGLTRALYITIFFSLAGPQPGSAAPTPTEAGTYIKAVYSLPLTLDPVQMNDTASLVAGNLIYDGLLRFSPTLKIESALADTWSTSADGKTLTFTLRKNAQFHNGDPITADDVVASLTRALAPTSPVRKFYDCIEGEDKPVTLARLGIQALDGRTVAIRLKHPFPPFLSVLAGATAKILPRKLISTPGFFDHPVGSGPFVFASKSLTPTKDLELTRFEKYYKGPPKIARMILRELPEAEAKIAAARGQLHDLANWPLTVNDSVFKSGKDISSPVAATWTIGMNVRKRPFTSASVRTLFKQDVDTEGFRKAFYPDASPALGYIPPGLPGYQSKENTKSRIHGRPPKDRVSLVIPSELAHAEQMRTFLETNLKAKGWNIEVATMEWDQLMKGYDEKTHQAFLVAMNMDYPDSEFLLRNFESSNRDNFSGLQNPELDRILGSARTLRDRKARESLYRQALQIIDNEAVTVNLFHPRANYWVASCVEGFTPNILADVYIDYSNVALGAGCERKVAAQ
ncbi:MAG: hypothetical protein A2070_01015 [Bdellovibrionales bacterium GWC1_52_8]|nr:MAG: hypothetical protein A2X97_12285 [Bdellovibrionales bacterium GWA1_52_35]OFZ39755.1 MAG: hypothetical protein A2070_01015 [Bdellovibrionales bacterium GWC1_52_8]HCM41612.1 hypothetical protein [Bdellovibrionales bacterium]